MDRYYDDEGLDMTDVVPHKASEADVAPTALTSKVKVPVRPPPPANKAPASLTVVERQQCVVVGLPNEQCAGLWKAIEPFIAAGKTGVVLDFAKVPFLDSVNIATIIATHKKVTAAGRRIAIANLAPNIQAVFRILKLDRLFDIHLDLDRALRIVEEN